MRRLLPVLAVCALSACSVVEAQQQIRGNKIDPDSLKELIVGTSKQADVQAQIGSPTSKGTFDDNVWIYASEVTQPRIGRVPGINSQEVVELTFDQSGTLRSIRKLNQDDAKPVTVVDRTTPSPGSETSFLQMLLGNVGKFSASPTGGLIGGGGSGVTLGQ